MCACVLPLGQLSSQSPPALFTSLSKDTESLRQHRKTARGTSMHLQSSSEAWTRLSLLTESDNRSSADWSDIEKDRRPYIWAVRAGCRYGNIVKPLLSGAENQFLWI